MATENKLQDYELMVIFSPLLAEEDYKGAQKKYTEFVTENGGKIIHEKAWGLRSLAYPIEKKTTGFYYVMEYVAPLDFNAKLEIHIGRDENLMRYMLTRLDKYAVEYNTRKRNKNAVAEAVVS